MIQWICGQLDTPRYPTYVYDLGYECMRILLNKKVESLYLSRKPPILTTRGGFLVMVMLSLCSKE